MNSSFLKQLLNKPRMYIRAITHQQVHFLIRTQCPSYWIVKVSHWYLTWLLSHLLLHLLATTFSHITDHMSTLSIPKSTNAIFCNIDRSLAFTGVYNTTVPTVKHRGQSLDVFVNICASMSLRRTRWNSCHSYVTSVFGVQSAATFEMRQWCCATENHKQSNPLNVPSELWHWASSLQRILYRVLLCR